MRPVAAEVPVGGRLAGQRGLTLIEILLALFIMGIMAAATVPLARKTVERQKELELRRALRIMRDAVDRYHQMAESGLITDENVEAAGYPADLETLVEGVQVAGRLDKVRFLRRIPKDPLTGTREWGLRSYQDEWDSRSWGRENVFDVYSLSTGVALDGSEYREW